MNVPPRMKSALAAAPAASAERGQPATLAGEDMTLEPRTPSHAAAMYALLRDPTLYRYLDHPPPASEEALLALYTRYENLRSPDGSEYWLNWVIRVPGPDVVGYVQATVMMASQSSWVAYVLGSEHVGRGYATQATRAMMNHLQSVYGVTRFWATVDPANAASIALLRRLGFEASPETQARVLGVAETDHLYGRGRLD
jgi:[ribosomal protein S5]-alanine N-acetyltransferase